MEIELANKVAVESGRRVLSLIYQQEDPQGRNLRVQTCDTICKFKRVVSLLGNGFDHARSRRLKNLPPSLPHKIFLETPHSNPDPPPNKPLQLLPSGFLRNPVSEIDVRAKNSSAQIAHQVFDEKPALDISLSVKPLGQISSTHQKPYQDIPFLQQQKILQRLQLQQQMVNYSGSGMNLKFDGSSCTQTVSSNRSFVSSLSIDGSMVSLGGSSFQLISLSQSSDPNSQQLRRRCHVKGEDGSVICSSSAKCHCSKKRFKFEFLFLSSVCSS